MRILIADGDEELLETMQPYLRKRGHDVKIASRDAECIASLFDSIPNILVLDHGLLSGGGDGILENVQANPQLADVRVILVADSQMQFDLHAGKNVVDWLPKPFKLSDLLLKISSATACLQLAGGSSEPRKDLAPRRGNAEPPQMLLRRCNPLRINTRHRQIPDVPR